MYIIDYLYKINDIVIKSYYKDTVYIVEFKRIYYYYRVQIYWVIVLYFINLSEMSKFLVDLDLVSLLIQSI